VVLGGAAGPWVAEVVDPNILIGEVLQRHFDVPFQY
jgi:hypothetical protein